VGESSDILAGKVALTAFRRFTRAAAAPVGDAQGRLFFL
jgi:hypothetical protein